ncbi:MAG TPA: pantetheine-phosphate adenylyltransferase [Algoriphagus sp.]|jgi:pantetheine-phosphate adenylyltransferase|uniref:Phosphopantetheine adenylyltransferase n=1 Tax=Algoriphagus ornithinivorans TaxID=226506 RepID=A0A1I5IW97_9BACT|nr:MULTISPECIES: pantetheine-phosphate adenylyltransferase [Algoriphagus]MAL12853.1 pantetheine-phosphate adenylyltransferase [Algoriphagus sp.]MAN85718.1 pantetheine-phosphate adenylyltransferase [Algoriphagus sp.]QYH39130.1 pantetheine-phosphate adenylyltransferase [Algoriphagus sp. NBT04N3]SFO64788.1 Phosphopantetheine adenylyltransferase [Algoriphagus ornithinivorans]HAD52832.1 pantetheine-phosphate adenylyltransferase [Algoriphagus sp.]|tara:strand:- start:294 stop:749 length:456 start_codon:yes stop_codon:yes gene_type:complete
MSKVAIFPGSFDPYTKGHHDIVIRSLDIFDEVIIGIGYNSTKKNRYFDIDLMVEKIESVYVDMPNVKVIVYNELTSTLAKKHGANFLIRGLRNTTDFEYENTISQMNRYLNEDLETVFLITTPQFAAISSTVIREVHRYGGDVSEFLPYSI